MDGWIYKYKLNVALALVSVCRRLAVAAARACAPPCAELTPPTRFHATPNVASRSCAEKKRSHFSLSESSAISLGIKCGKWVACWSQGKCFYGAWRAYIYLLLRLSTSRYQVGSNTLPCTRFFFLWARCSLNRNISYLFLCELRVGFHARARAFSRVLFGESMKIEFCTFLVFWGGFPLHMPVCKLTLNPCRVHV